MSQNTIIKWGCDLGTTNSCIAHKDHQGLNIARSNDTEDVTPSAVYRKLVGDRVITRVGKKAKQSATIKNGFKHVAQEFKRLIGSKDWCFEFPGIEKPSTATNLSTDVLKEVLGCAKRDEGESLIAAIISVPMAFLQPQCDATVAAAKAAGLKYVELVKEPIAAALAYGMGVEEAKTVYWLVYDLGGGTFDAAIMKYEDRIPTVIAAGGDPNLGGKDLDEAIVKDIFLPSLPDSLAKKVIPKESWEWCVLKGRAEEAKCMLSTVDKSDDYRDLDGTDYDLPLTRSELDALEEKVFGSTIKICKSMIEEAGLEKNSIERVVLVGGSTMSPNIRKMIGDGLGIKVDFSMDAMTAVAKGAAIYASMTEIPEEYRTKQSGNSSKSAVRIDWKSQSVSSSEDAMLTGSLVTKDKKKSNWVEWGLELHQVDSEGNEVSLVEDVTPADNGSFAVMVSITKGENYFRLVVRDAKGDVVDIDNADRTIAFIEDTPPPVALERTIGIVGPDGMVDPVFEKGTPLPASCVETRVTTRELKRGGNDPILIPLVEGNEAKASLNYPIQTIEIGGQDVRNDIPVGSLIQVSIDIDRSRSIVVTVTLDDHDVGVSVEAQMDLSPVVLGQELKKFEDDFDKMKQVASADDTVGNLVREIKSSGDVGKVRELFNSVTKRNPEPGQKGFDLLLGLKIRIDPCLKRTYQLVNFLNILSYCDKNTDTGMAIVGEATGLSDEWKAQFEDMMKDYQKAVKDEDTRVMQNIAFSLMLDLLKSNEILGPIIKEKPLELPSKVIKRKEKEGTTEDATGKKRVDTENVDTKDSK